MDPIVIEGLSKFYGERLGIRDIDLAVPEGSLYGFLGPNGAGKTTTIRTLLGLLRPSRGSAQIFGRDCWRQSPKIKADLGYVPGDLRLYPWMTGKSALAVVGKFRGRDLRVRGADLAKRFDLEMEVRVRNMSRGMRQKLGLLLALAHEPKLLILDEPTTALDPLMQQWFYGILRNMAQEGATVFFSSHTLSEVEDLCDHVAVVRQGRLVTAAPLEDLKKRAQREVVLVWQEDLPGMKGSIPEFLNVFRKQKREWHCSLSGPVMPLVRWASEQPLADIRIGKPNLESMFRRFYEEEAP